MLSACHDTKLVMKGISHGACDYLLKPVRLEELKNLWQHVIRRKNPRGVVWSVELHRKFVAAVNHLAIDSMFYCSSPYLQFNNIFLCLINFFMLD